MRAPGTCVRHAVVSLAVAALVWTGRPSSAAAEGAGGPHAAQGAGAQSAGAQNPAAPPVAPILVMPFENLSGLSRLMWLQEASSVLLADDLRAAGAPAIARTDSAEQFS